MGDRRVKGIFRRGRAEVGRVRRVFLTFTPSRSGIIEIVIGKGFEESCSDPSKTG